METNKIQNILNDIEKYESYNFEDNVKERLDKSLNLYLDELEKAYVGLRMKDTNFMVKELGRQ